MALPIALAPIGAPRLFHHEGERAAASAAHRARVPYAVSTLSTVAMDELPQEGTLWFQLYLWGDRSVSRDLVARARDLGYRALLLTVVAEGRRRRRRCRTSLCDIRCG